MNDCIFLIIRTSQFAQNPYANWHLGMAKQHETSPTRPFKTKKWPLGCMLVSSGRPNIIGAVFATLRKLFEGDFCPRKSKNPGQNDRDF
jgi:hypothetical protein